MYEIIGLLAIGFGIGGFTCAGIAYYQGYSDGQKDTITDINKKVNEEYAKIH